jgi:hypothetical protein
MRIDDLEQILKPLNGSEAVTQSENEYLSVVHVTGRDLLEVVQKCAEKLAAKMEKPDVLMFYPSGYDPSDKKLHERVCKILKETFPDSQMCGGLFGSTFSNEGYSLRGVTLAGIKGIDAEIVRAKNLRIKSKKKGKKMAKELAKRIKPDHNAVVLFGGFGPNYPPLLLNQMKFPRRFHAFMMMNSSLFLRVPILGKLMGKVMGMTMDRLNIGLHFNSLNAFLVELNKQGVRFAGGSAVDSMNYRAPPIFINFKVYYKDSWLLLLQSKTLKFGLSIGIAGNCERTEDNEVKFGHNMPGGFVFKLDGKWARDALFDRLKIPPEIYYKEMWDTIYMDSYHPLIVDYPDCDHNPIVILGMNPNLKASMYTVADEVAEKLKKGEARAYMGYQSASDVAETVQETLTRAKEQQDIEKVEFGFVFECLNRMLILGDQFKNLVAKSHDYFGNVPFVGMTTSGEFISSTVPTNNCSVVCLVVGQ